MYSVSVTKKSEKEEVREDIRRRRINLGENLLFYTWNDRL